MPDFVHRTREAAIGAALREAKRQLLSSDAICLKVYASLGIISVFELRGRKQRIVSQHRWKAA